MKTKHLVVVGGGAALAQPVMARYREKEWRVTAVCRSTQPTVPGVRVVEYAHEVPYDNSGPVDLLVTMTGKAINAKLGGMQRWEWDMGIADNLTSVFEALNRLLPGVADGGNVVVVGSVVGRTGGVGCANYAAAKAGLVGLVKAASNEVAERGVCVNLLELGYINAGMGEKLPEKVAAAVMKTIPLRRFGKVEDVVAAVEYLAGVRYMTGNVLTLAGGL